MGKSNVRLISHILSKLSRDGHPYEVRKINLGRIGTKLTPTSSTLWANFRELFLLPLSHGSSPFEKEAHKDSIIWGEEIGLIDDSNRHKVDLAFFSSLFGSNLPTKEQLLQLTKVSIFLFVLDDQLDRRDVIIDSDLLLLAFKIFIDIFNGFIPGLVTALSILSSDRRSPSDAFKGFKFVPLCRAALHIREFLVDIVSIVDSDVDSGVDDKVDSRVDSLSFFEESLKDYLMATHWACNGGFRQSTDNYIRFRPTSHSYIIIG